MKIQFERIKLFRIFNVFNPEVYKLFLSMCAFFLVPVSLLIFLSSNVEYSDFFGLAIPVIWVLFYEIIHCAKYLEANEGCFTFSEYVVVKYRYLGFIRPKYRRRVKVEFRVDNVKIVGFSQNFIEKAFDVGRISFEGKTTFYADRYPDLIVPPERFTIYGIKDFDRFKSMIERSSRMS